MKRVCTRAAQHHRNLLIRNGMIVGVASHLTGTPDLFEFVRQHQHGDLDGRRVKGERVTSLVLLSRFWSLPPLL